MSRQLAISACISILAMAGLALAGPAIVDHSSDHAKTGAGTTTMAAAPAISIN